MTTPRAKRSIRPRAPWACPILAASPWINSLRPATTTAFPSSRAPTVDGAPLDFSFSALKTAVINILHNAEQQGQTVNIADLSASYRKAVVDCLVRNFLHAADETGHKKLVIAGGVSANALLRRRLTEECKRTGRTLYMPDLSLTGDNAAMVGAQAYYEYLAGHTAGDGAERLRPALHRLR